MISATKASVTSTYALNAFGQRVKKTTSGSSRYFVYDEAGNLAGEYDNSGNLIQETIWFADTPIATLRPNGASMSLFYVHTDHLNTPRRISRPSDNAVLWRWDSDPFGTTAANEDPDGDSNLFVYGLRFPGQYLDSETGLHYNYFRDYDPGVGRYVESDPIGLGDGTNTYAYVANDPTSGIDPLGLSVFKIIKLCAKGYKVVKEVDFKRAVQALRRGDDVLASSTKQARKVAKAAGTKGKATRDPPHGEGYMPHHHPRPRTGGHVFRDMAAGMTLADHVECEDCIPAYLAEIGDFFNPLRAPNDAIEIFDVITGED
jgi:RHS repeat-associated protein